MAEDLLKLKLIFKVPTKTDERADELINDINNELKKSKKQGLGKKVIKKIKNIFFGKAEEKNLEYHNDESDNLEDDYKKLKRWYLKYYEDEGFRTKISKCIKDYELIYGNKNPEYGSKDLNLENNIKIEMNLCKTVFNKMSEEIKKSKAVQSIVNELFKINENFPKKEWEEILEEIELCHQKLKKAKQEAEEKEAEEKARKESEEKAKKEAREKLDKYWVFDWNMNVVLSSAKAKLNDLKESAGEYGEYILRESVRVKELADKKFEEGSLTPQYNHKTGDSFIGLKGPYYVLVNDVGQQYKNYKFGIYDCLNRKESSSPQAEEEALETLKNIYDNGGKYIEQN